LQSLKEERLSSQYRDAKALLQALPARAAGCALAALCCTGQACIDVAFQIPAEAQGAGAAAGAYAPDERDVLAVVQCRHTCNSTHVSEADVLSWYEEAARFASGVDRARTRVVFLYASDRLLRGTVTATRPGLLLMTRAEAKAYISPTLRCCYLPQVLIIFVNRCRF
jgi:hypothetical protein